MWNESRLLQRWLSPLGPGPGCLVDVTHLVLNRSSVRVCRRLGTSSGWESGVQKSSRTWFENLCPTVVMRHVISFGHKCMQTGSRRRNVTNPWDAVMSAAGDVLKIHTCSCVSCYLTRSLQFCAEATKLFVNLPTTVVLRNERKPVNLKSSPGYGYRKVCLFFNFSTFSQCWVTVALVPVGQRWVVVVVTSVCSALDEWFQSFQITGVFTCVWKVCDHEWCK